MKITIILLLICQVVNCQYINRIIHFDKKSTNTYIYDNFDGADGTALTSHVLTTGQNWICPSGKYSMKLSSNNAVPYGSVAGDNLKQSFNVVESNLSDVNIEIKWQHNVSGSSKWNGVIVRYVDTANYIMVAVDNEGNGFRIIRHHGSKDSSIVYNNYTPGYGSTYILKISAIGNTVTATYNSHSLSMTSSFNQTATKHGLSCKYYNLGTQYINTYYYFLLYGNYSMPVNPEYPFVLQSPSAYQVFQRNGSNKANIFLTGKFQRTGTYTVQANWKNMGYQDIAITSNGYFSGYYANADTGQGTFEIRLKEYTSAYLAINYVGVGDVYVTYGQSNILGELNAYQTYSHPRLKAGLFAKDYKWKELTDPTGSEIGIIDKVSQGNLVNGSYLPLLATLIMADQKVPVAFIPCPKIGTPIIDFLPRTNHQDRNTLYGSMIIRSNFNCKAVLFHQGEGDATINGFTGYSNYKSRLKTLADAVYSDLGVKLVVTQIHYWNGAPSTTLANVQEIDSAMVDAVSEDSNILMGANLLSPEITQSLHFVSNADGQEVANRVWSRLKTLFY